ncbi:hypothetical protein HYP93_gp91 [Stenotrophomonas phage Pokken]|uniref:Uncharacterized protein n=1 Tax=Stenotrophomonas phage Pokken TaxID=2596674 RepID=A0A5B9N9I3_9CAUD|nr:hypothetical protein HYP93_gp91 [Stenotrophomonas phage Pokken]QEG09266.1 hypothetical protein CPT_Pokken_048 [Stenotrophomonas phage Pokken]
MSRSWMNPLPRPAVPARQTWDRNSGSKMIQFELINELSETDQAHLLIFVLEGQNIGRWLPKSQIKIPYADVVEIPRWLVDRIKEEIKSYGQADK